MSLSKSTLSAIQQAGQALHKATVVVAGAVREQAEHMVATVASQPFEAEGDQAFANFKMLARLSQDLLALEEQLKSLYANASDLASPVMDVVSALPHAGPRARAAAQTQNDAAEDAVVKPASETRSRRTAAPAKAASKAAGKASAKVAGKAAGKAGKPRGATLSANDTRLLNFLQSALNRTAWTALTGVTMAQGSGLPLGSVGVSLKRVMAMGAIKKTGRGSYKLAAA